MKTVLQLQDGTKFYGGAIGADCAVEGELAFSTVMTGRLDGLAEFKDKILVLTFPLIVDADTEGLGVPCVKALVIKELCGAPANRTDGGTLDAYLRKHNIVGLTGVDTRALTIKIRSGVTKGKIYAEK